MDDDFNSAAALAGLADDARGLNEALAMKGKDPRKPVRIATLARSIAEQGAVLGLCQRDPAETLLGIQERKAARTGLDRAAVDALVAERTTARGAKDFARADAVRDTLLGMGVVIMDGPEGTRWKVA
jgi:cysteinyl-tRNA synthetase